MKTEVCESLGVKFQLTGVPETPEEYDTLAKRPGACVADANDNTKYRSSYPVFRAAFMDAVETETGIPRPTETITNKDGSTREEWINSERKDFNNVLAQLKKKPTDFQHLADAITVEFDPSLRERVGGPKKLSKKFTEAAAELIKGGHADAMANKLSKILGKPVATDETSLGWAIKEWDDSKAKPLANELLAA